MRRILIALLFISPVLFNCPSYAALAIDVSTPPVIDGASSEVQNITTASFTPPAGSVLYILICLNSNTFAGENNQLTGISDNLFTHLAYTQQLAEGNPNTNDTLAYLYTAPVTVSHAMTITVTQESSLDGAAELSLVQVLVVTGANAANPVGQIGGGRGATGKISDNYTSSANNSWGWLIYSDWNGVAIPTPGAAQSLYDSYTSSGLNTYAVIQQNSTTPSSGTSVTMSTTAPTSGAQISHIYFEINPAGPVSTTLGNAKIYNATIY